MPSARRIVRRSLTGAAVAAVVWLGPAAPAWAHIHASSDDASRNGYATVTFQVPNESTTGAATTALTIDLAAVTAVQTEAKPGWTAKIDRSGDKVSSVTWTALPNNGIPPEQFDVFRITAKLPDTDSVGFPATQTYAGGEVVQWNQPTGPGGAEPEHPTPTLTLSGGARPSPTAHAAPSTSSAPTATASPAGPPAPKVVDTTSRILSGAALLVGALGVGLALIVRRP